MFLHFKEDHILISKQIAELEVPYTHILMSIKSSLKFGLPVVILFDDIDYKLGHLRKKHFYFDGDVAFVNTSLKNRFPIDHKIECHSEMLDYMLDLSSRLS